MTAHFDPDLALERAMSLWTATNRVVFRMHRKSNHECTRSACGLFEVPYEVLPTVDGPVPRLVRVERRGGANVLTLGAFPWTRERLIPLFCCDLTGALHACGSKCRYYLQGEPTCPLSGTSFGQVRTDVPSSKFWLVPAAQRVASADGRMAEHERSEAYEAVCEGRGDKYAFDAGLDDRVGAKHRWTKAGAFDTAFVVACVALGRARMLHDIETMTSVLDSIERRGREDAASRLGTRLSVAEYDDSPAPQSVNVLLVPASAIVDKAARFAVRCMALWHLLREEKRRKPERRASTGFVEFAIATFYLFGTGYSVVDWTSRIEECVIQRDPVLELFPPNDWCLRALRPNVDRERFLSRIRAAGDAIRREINGAFASGSTTIKTLNVHTYDSLPPFSFASDRPKTTRTLG